ncbi:isoaspartyl peptidase/L-asparaginase family protein [Paraburkholderia sp. DD10]|jgi:beta-aspartyl-peptidase (threonine type)|uniref:Isoaspartyl peptidase n=1 Tax=Paraburkholderia terricola TaxID=169427 RepID=A0A1M6JH52_9BURK|nr:MULTISPECIES: isoaspartyl peptidase/L-asparaginase [Paraburkholderia]ORC48777.1 beta-aspartyl-peptidase [Burkholderia sp. A27]SDN61965.1 beta-aspartyl-peptidase (threonine type) [Paraburkholderia sediminicola]SHJ46049.1 beta-aspartyl-peptidase (threonine type) [Paraburkholderia terricola]
MNSNAVIAIHGGAGTILRASMSSGAEAEYHAALHAVLSAGQRILADGGSALDAVSEAVRLLEDCPLFNAGRGAVYTAAGTHELDAAIMDGGTLEAGAICCVKRVRNPILAARRVLESSEHVLFTGEGAEAFAAAHGLEFVEPGYFHTEARHHQWLLARDRQRAMLDHDGATLAGASSTNDDDPAPHEPIDPNRKFGTVGAVALDRHGHVAAATSTGGVTNKQVGRVGDTPLIGAGCYADDATCAVSTTGSGEMFMRMVAAYDVAAQMAYRQVSLEEAAHDVVMNRLPRIDGRGGLIAVDARGNVTLPFNTEGMYRGFARPGETPVTAIYR